MSVENYTPPERRPAFALPEPASLFNVPQDFLEILPIAVYACATDGRVLWFNKRAAELWGRSPGADGPGELYCGSHKVFLGGRLLPRDETPMAMVLRTGIAVRGAEVEVERPDGTRVWTVMHVEPVEDETGVLIAAVNCFHETLEPHLQQQRRLDATYEQAGVGIVEIDAEGRLLRVNKHICQLLGCSEQELLGQCLFDLTHPGDATTDRFQYSRQMAGEIEGYTLEKRFLRKDGSHLWASITSRSVRDAEGRFLYAVRAQQDITARKDAEAKLVRYAQQKAILHDLTVSLQHATSLDDVYQSSMDAMSRTLGCQRASVLLFDASKTMRFVAWRNLSEGYRKAVDGHSPWSADTRNPSPVCIDDVARSSLPDDLKNVVLAEGIQALAFVPLQESGRLLGKFMLYYDAPHAFTKDETDLALTVAWHVGFSVERMQAQRAALQLAAIVESSEDAIISKHLDGTITSWNYGAERLFGYSAEEAVGRSVTMLIPPDRLDEEPKIIGRIHRGERVEHFETLRRRKDGSLIDISLTISPIRDPEGRIVGASKIARDITERKLAEAKLRDSEHQLQQLLAAIPAAIYTTDAEGRITYFNEPAVELAGRRPELGSDKWCVTWKLYWPDGTPLPHDQCPMAIALKEGRIIRNVEALAERPDGTRVPFIPYPTPLRDAKGNIVGAINMLVDVSQRKEAEAQQRVLLNELNHRVKNNMQMLQSLLSTSARRTKSVEAHEVLHEASGRIGAMAAAQRVLYQNTNATRFNAAEFFAAVCETARHAFPPGIHVACEAAPVELGNDDAMPLALILNELLTNAVKHGMEGRDRGVIRVTFARRGDTCALDVEDEGPGFDFEQAKSRSSGLSLVQGLVRQLGGTFTSSRTPAARAGIEFSRSSTA
jgi:PAS domain S-box-containing protein